MKKLALILALTCLSGCAGLTDPQQDPPSGITKAELDAELDRAKVQIMAATASAVAGNIPAAVSAAVAGAATAMSAKEKSGFDWEALIQYALSGGLLGWAATRIHRGKPRLAS